MNPDTAVTIGGGKAAENAAPYGGYYGPSTPIPWGSGKNSFTVFGIIAVGIILWATAQNADADIKRIINYFLLVLFVSMVLLNWDKVGPLFIKKGA